VGIERQRIWDILLNNFRIVVSAYAVLADALGHGFVTIDRIELLVFDEGKSVMYESDPNLLETAHHRARDHPANKIMADYYHPSLRFCVGWGGGEGGP
jgi:hypothetical protein